MHRIYNDLRWAITQTVDNLRRAANGLSWYKQVLGMQKIIMFCLNDIYTNIDPLRLILTHSHGKHFDKSLS